MVFHVEVVSAVLISILLSVVIYKVKAKELRKLVVSAFEKKMLGNMFLVLVLKEFIAYTGVLTLLPEAMSSLPLPVAPNGLQNTWLATQLNSNSSPL